VRSKEKIHLWDSRAVLYSLLVSTILVATSVWIMFRTMGHAGPEGPWSTIGWLAVIINFPAMVIARLFPIPPDASAFTLGAILFFIQMPLVWYLLFVIFRFRCRWR